MTLRVGMIGLDTSHVTAFCKILNDPTHPHHIPGARVTVGFPGASPDFDLSRNRVAGFTQELRDLHGVTILTSPEAVAEACELLFITSVDGRAHRAFFERTVAYLRPTFIDKPFAVNVDDARAIFALADQHGVPVMGSSALRYDTDFQACLQSRRAGLIGVDVFGPMSEQPTQPGLFWYGIHSVELVVATLGPGCRAVRATTNADFDLIACEWADGRMASIRGTRKGHGKFGVVLHDGETATHVEFFSEAKRPPYAGLLEAILRSLPNGTPDVPRAETLEVIRLIAAANESRTAGRVVQL